MTDRHRAAGALLLAAAALLGCEAGMDPFDVLESDDLRSRLTISPLQVAPGGSVALRVETTNSGDRRISASNGCAPGLGFRVLGPSGDVMDPYAGRAFTCPRLDSQDLDPDETDVVEWQWVAPLAPGRYEVIGGLVVDDRIVGPSARQAFEVRR